MENWTKVRIIRKNVGLTQDEFSKILNITRSHLSNIESGDRGITLDIALKICNIFDISMDWFTRDLGEAPSTIHIVKKYESSLKPEKVL